MTVAPEKATLDAELFPAFYQGVHGFPPFPWQANLARRVLAERAWPALLDLPTGSGKTSALDVALFALAVAPAWAPRRVVLVVDRRVIVNQAAEHARAILDALTKATNGLLRRVADALRTLSNASADEPPFQVAVLRGGMPRDDAWARRPDRPCIAVSTVDQVGSRLLFRGYGISARMAPVHAGLLGNDVLYLLDEVHLSVPFCETLEAITQRHRKFPAGVPNRFGFTRMSATAGASTDPTSSFHLGDDDRRPKGVLALRLGASKVARFETVEVPKGTSKNRQETAYREALAAACARAARKFLGSDLKTLAVVVNRVDTARRVRALLAEHDDADVLLVTGRMRPLDRDAMLTPELLQRLTDRSARGEGDRPLVLVATQCIEAGADFDFDALVTECASLDALRQRFGRLNRHGKLGQTKAVILARKDQIADNARDPVYGAALAATWKWMIAVGETEQEDTKKGEGRRKEKSTRQGNQLNFGVDHLKLPAADTLRELLAPVEHAPILLPTYLDTWVQTSPVPEPDAEPSVFLHGPERGAPEVQLVWRADLDAAALEAQVEDPSALVALLEECPPGSLEALSVPLRVARAWLEGDREPPVSDVLGAHEETSDDGSPARDRPRGRLVLRWAGEVSEVLAPKDIRPGQVLVVPSTYGGIAHGTWDPNSTDPVTDLGDLVQWLLRGRATLRLHGAVLPVAFGNSARSTLPRVPKDDADVRDAQQDLRAWFAALPSDLPQPWPTIVRALRQHRRVARPDDSWVLIARKRQREPEDTEATTEEERGSFLGREVSLAEHSQDVRAWCERFAKALGLPDPLARDLALAGWFHDIGKADPRFQRLLLGGSDARVAALPGPLAKSADLGLDARARAKARALAQYPQGYRHEVLSLHMLEAEPDALASANDMDLVRYLVASHHGWCRPFAPPAPEGPAVPLTLQHDGVRFATTTAHGRASVGSGVAERFWNLVEKYGHWGLAWMEAVLRLADHRASEAKQEVDE
ncbi:MAG: type I-U CRISPR-associated helicase/endonuclease Cas3 [Deltaproteobacteria bacterium]|nr:type I-U CRISPR-associated helicase/endonuclease Cas3 [Deltaproteobacteria bacterium]